MDVSKITPIESAYLTLMIMTVVDGHYSPGEGKVIIDYLAKHYKEEVDCAAMNQLLLNVDKEQIPTFYKELCGNMSIHYSEERILDYIGTLARVVWADGLISAEERKIYESTCNFFGHDDLKQLISEEPIFTTKI